MLTTEQEELLWPVEDLAINVLNCDLWSALKNTVRQASDHEDFEFERMMMLMARFREVDKLLDFTNPRRAEAMGQTHLPPAVRTTSRSDV